MKHSNFILTIFRLLPALLLTTSISVNAQEPPSEEPVPTSLIGSSENVEGKLSNEFAEFLSGSEQAGEVVDGLRQGTSFSLETTPEEPVDTGATSTIDPPTGSMGYGNVRMTLRLAEAKLAEYDITQPTSEQLSAVLLGGEINGSQVEGILSMRAEGMGWGDIAHQYDMKVGQIMGNGKGLTTTTSTSSTTAITNAAGKTIPASANSSNGYIASGKSKALGQGIVSGNGNQVSTLSSNNGSKGVSNAAGGGKGKVHTPAGKAHGAGIVSANGNAVAATGISAAGGKGLAKGHSKKSK
ncbi:MAG: hypothetical protein V7739_12685 [Motiliproteus sp.]